MRQEAKDQGKSGGQRTPAKAEGKRTVPETKAKRTQAEAEGKKAEGESNKKEENRFGFPLESGYCDSNTGPSGPKPDALANCATPRIPVWDCKYTGDFVKIKIFRRIFNFFKTFLIPFLYKSSIPYVRGISKSGYGITSVYGEPSTSR